MTPTLKRPADPPVVIPCRSALMHHQARGIGNRPRVTHAVPGDAALFPTPGGEQTVLAVCGTTAVFPAPGGRRPPLFPRFGSPLVCQRCRHRLHLHPSLDAERTVLLAAVNRLDAQAGSVHDLIGRVQRYAAAGQWTGPVRSPARARAILDELVACRLVTVVQGAQLPRYLGCAPDRPGEHYYLPADLIEMVDGHAPDPITPPDYDLAV